MSAERISEIETSSTARPCAYCLASAGPTTIVGHRRASALKREVHRSHQRDSDPAPGMPGPDVVHRVLTDPQEDAATPEAGDQCEWERKRVRAQDPDAIKPIKRPPKGPQRAEHPPNRRPGVREAGVVGKGHEVHVAERVPGQTPSGPSFPITATRSSLWASSAMKIAKARSA